jgi:endonuclease YncB( thermonuclease family)
MKLGIVAIGLLLVGTGCSGERSDFSNAGATSGWTVVAYIDGDTIDVKNTFGHVERIRLIGIDTPEKGECGYFEATGALAMMIKDSKVRLVPGAQTDRDQTPEQRLLRYVEVNGKDVGLELIEKGFGVAAYDSRDIERNYGPHAREDKYVKTDESSTNQCPDMAPGRQ